MPSLLATTGKTCWSDRLQARPAGAAGTRPACSRGNVRAAPPPGHGAARTAASRKRYRSPGSGVAVSPAGDSGILTLSGICPTTTANWFRSAG